MNPNFYRDLLWDLSRNAGLPDPHRLIDDGQLRIDGTDLALSYEEHLDPWMVQIRVDLGPLPEAGRERVTEAMLTANYRCGVGGVCTFSLQPGQGRAALLLQQRLEPHFTGQQFAEALRDAVRRAQEGWTALTQAAARPSANASVSSAPRGLHRKAPQRT